MKIMNCDYFLRLTLINNLIVEVHDWFIIFKLEVYY